MTKTIAHLISNNGYTALIITDANGSRMHMIGDGPTMRCAITTGDDQDLDNWSGDILDDGVSPEDCGDVIAINDGTTLTVLDDDKLAERIAFFGA